MDTDLARQLGAELIEQTVTLLRNVPKGLCRVTHEDGLSVITEIYVPPTSRRRGFGSNILDNACYRADQDGQILAVSPVPEDDQSPSRGQLESWFMAHGFTPNRGPYADPTIQYAMYRRPRG